MTSMTHAQIQELLPAFALGALTHIEEATVAAHLTECAECRSTLAEYREAVALLAYALPPSTPPPALKQRVLQHIAPAPVQPRRPGLGERLSTLWPRLAPVWGAISLLTLLILVWGILSLQSRLQAQQAELQRLAQTQSVLLYLNQDGWRSVPLKGTEVAASALGVLYFEPQGAEGALLVSGLSPLPPGKAYQLWLIHNGQRDNGGVFTVNNEGMGALFIHAPAPMATYQAVGVTIEPISGSHGPTGPKVLGGTLHK